MRTKPCRSLALLLPLLTLASLGPRSVRAEQPSYLDHEAAMTAASTMAALRGGGAIWYNPAGLDVDGLQRIGLSGSVFALRIRDLQDTVRTRLPSGDYRADHTDPQVLPVPSSLVYQRRLKPRLTLALAVLVTQAESFAVQSNLSRTERFPGDPTPVDLVGRGDMTHQGQTYRLGAALAGTLGRRLRLGLGVFGVYGAVEESSVFSMEVSDVAHAATPSGLLLLTQQQRRASWLGAQLVGGVQWNAVAGLHLGLTLRSPVLSLGRFGETLSAAAVLPLGTRFAGGTVSVQERRRLPVAAGTMLEPLHVTLGAAWRGRRFLVGVEGDLDLPLPERWHGFGEAQGWQGNLRAGARFWLRRRVSLGLGAFTDRTAKTRPGFVGDHRVDFYGGTFGVEWRSRYRIMLPRKVQELRFVTAVALRYAAGRGRLLGVRYAPTAATYDELARLNLEERDVAFHTLSVYVGSSLEF